MCNQNEWKFSSWDFVYFLSFSPSACPFFTVVPSSEFNWRLKPPQQNSFLFLIYCLYVHLWFNFHSCIVHAYALFDGWWNTEKDVIFDTIIYFRFDVMKWVKWKSCKCLKWNDENKGTTKMSTTTTYREWDCIGFWSGAWWIIVCIGVGIAVRTSHWLDWLTYWQIMKRSLMMGWVVLPFFFISLAEHFEY